MSCIPRVVFVNSYNVTSISSLNTFIIAAFRSMINPTSGGDTVCIFFLSKGHPFLFLCNFFEFQLMLQIRSVINFVEGGSCFVL